MLDQRDTMRVRRQWVDPVTERSGEVREESPGDQEPGKLGLDEGVQTQSPIQLAGRPSGQLPHHLGHSFIYHIGI